MGPDDSPRADPLSELDFSTLAVALDTAGTGAGAAECHATLTGLICAGPALPSDWMTYVTGGGDAPERCAGVLEQLEVDVRAALGDTQMAFDIFVPDDDTELQERAQALAQWCQGFIYGLTVGGIRANQPLPGDVAEIIRDFSTLSEAAHEGEAMEADEAAYAELCEFVRVGAQLVYETLQGTPPPQ